MNVYKLCWVLLKAIARGHGTAPLFFDTEGRKFDYHLAYVGSAYCKKLYGIEGPWCITLHEELN